LAQRIVRQVERAQLLLDALDIQEWTTSTELGTLLGIGRQAVTPYVESLREMGHPIETVRGKGHRLTARPHEGSLLLTEEELYILFLSLSRSKADFPERVLGSLKKRILNLLSTRRQTQAKALKVSIDSEGPFFQDLAVLQVIQLGLERGSLLRILYQGFRDSEARYRRVLPIEFVPKLASWYLVCWDADKDDERHLRIDRISEAITLPDQIELPPTFHRASMHPWDFGREHLKTVLQVTPDLARWLKENPAHPSQSFAESPDGGLEVSYSISSPGKFIDWLMGLRGFRLMSPDSVVKKLQERAQKLLSDQGTFNTPWEL
jgi:predicted DNA-binding transcriptional regulator YafY